jgi:hypothetical protein
MYNMGIPDLPATPTFNPGGGGSSGGIGSLFGGFGGMGSDEMKKLLMGQALLGMFSKPGGNTPQTSMMIPRRNAPIPVPGMMNPYMLNQLLAGYNGF